MKKLLLLVILSLPSAYLFSQYSETKQTPMYCTTDSLDDDYIASFVDELLTKVEYNIQTYVEKKRSRDDEETTNDSVISHNGDLEIAEGDTLRGDVVVKKGNLTVRGILDGDALVVNGNIFVKDGGKITGNARAINGTITREPKGIVVGFVEETSSSSASRFGQKERSIEKRWRTFSEMTEWEDGHANVLYFHYNRVEGLFFGVGKEKKYYWDGSKPVSGYGGAGYGIKTHRWNLQLGLDRQFANDDVIYEIGTQVHSIADSKDAWIMGLTENTITAIFVQEDYRDYFWREGFSFHTARLSKETGFETMLKLEYSNDRYSALSKQTDWAIFHPSGSLFRENPAVNEGYIKSISLSATLNNVERERRQQYGWNVFAVLEKSGSELGGNFNFTQGIVDVQRYQPLSRYDNINVRVRVGTLEGDYITQKTFELGGANTMPAFGFKEFSGNRMVLGNLEYVVRGNVLDDVFFFPHSLNFIAFADAGVAKVVSIKKQLYEGFDLITPSQFKSGVGFALGWHDGSGRLGFAWRTDISAPVSLFLRLSRPF